MCTPLKGERRRRANGASQKWTGSVWRRLLRALTLNLATTRGDRSISMISVHCMKPFSYDARLLIECQISPSFCGRQRTSLLYQVVVGFPNIVLVSLALFWGKNTIATIWRQTDVDFLQDNGLYVLGDKGYVGCECVYRTKKKKKDS